MSAGECFVCGGEGRLANVVKDRETGFKTTYYKTCQFCKGTGKEEEQPDGDTEAKRTLKELLNWQLRCRQQ